MENDKCLVCKTAVPVAKYLSCDHVVYCSICVNSLFVTNALPVSCPKCSVKLTYITVPCNKEECDGRKYILRYYNNKIQSYNLECGACKQKTLKSAPKYDPSPAIMSMFRPIPDEYIKPMILIGKKSATWEDDLHVWFKNIREKEWVKPGKKCMFTPEQTMQLAESIGEKKIFSTDKYWIRNEMVAWCMVPWKLPTSVFSHGLCYHGNFGEVGGMDIVYNNINQIKHTGKYGLF